MDDQRIIRFIPRPHIHHPVEIKVTGRKDPRGPDNSVFVWLDNNDKLHITVYKADRCYKFEKIIETPGFIDVVAV